MGTGFSPQHRPSPYDPENQTFWEGPGKRIARRNLVASVLAEHVSFSVWSLWSVLVLFMSPDTGQDFTAGQKFMLVVAPTVVGGLLRVPYSRAVIRFGGRTWTTLLAGALVVPAALDWYLVRRPDTPLWGLLLAAALTGVAGGSFGSSMTNVAFLYPRRQHGWALGLNAGGGNLGVAGVQLIGVLVLATVGDSSPSLVVAVYFPLIVLATLVAARRMDNIDTGPAPRGAIRDGLRHPYTWWSALLYVGTFGSFIGYALAFGLLLKSQFDSSALQAASFAVLGPLLGSLARPLGGRLADRWDAPRLTLVLFGLLGAGALVLLEASAHSSMPLFIASFAVMFVLTGAGNGSVYRMIPWVFAHEAEDAVARGADPAPARARAQRLTAAAIGIAGAAGALGGAGINYTFRLAYDHGGSAAPAFWAFFACYAVCALVVWRRYLRLTPGPVRRDARVARVAR